MHSVLLVVHVLVAVSLIGLVMIQRGKGADAGAAFGSGASSTVFGSQGTGTFLTRTTAVLATVFFVTSLSLAFLGVSKTTAVKSVTDLPAPAAQEKKAPAGSTKTAPAVPSGGGSSAPADVPAAPPGD